MSWYKLSSACDVVGVWTIIMNKNPNLVLQFLHFFCSSSCVGGEWIWSWIHVM